MRAFNFKVLIFILIGFSFFSCRTTKPIALEMNLNEKLNLDVKSNDFSKSAKDAVTYLKSLIENPEISSIDVEIYNFHGGVYEQYCRIEKKEQLLILQTTVIGMDGTKKTTDRKVNTVNFVSSLNELEQNSERQIVAAGNYQKIYIRIENIEKVFMTRKAFGLMATL